MTRRLPLVCYAISVLLGAFLLFQVQPILSKYILPWFGGSPAVWTTCMLFFQLLLLAGYGYAHLIDRWLKPTGQLIVHLILLVSAVAMLPIVPSDSWKPQAGDDPTWRILGLLTITVGVPYFVLAATGPLMQAWFSRTYPGRSPYRLYALSNAGSLLALVSYPFLVEPRLDLPTQAAWWASGLSLFAAACALSAVYAYQARAAHVDSSIAEAAPAQMPASAPSLRDRVMWLLLPALASTMLLATTNHVCQDVAVVPLLWVVPLSLYLLSFIICFDHERWYRRYVYGVATLLVCGTLWVMDQWITTGPSTHSNLLAALVLNFCALFLICMVCHGELVRLKPDPKYLTSFYLAIAAGGALGGIFVTLIAPQIFVTLFEWKLGIFVGAALAGQVILEERVAPARRQNLDWVTPVAVLLLLGVHGAASFMHGNQTEVIRIRNFYGTAGVVELSPRSPEDHAFMLYNGRIIHGLQFTSGSKRDMPTTYFGHDTGIGQLFALLTDRRPLRVGLVGLGIGTLAACAWPGDEFQFYEINPGIVSLANKYFSYLSGCRGKAQIVLGDARLALERQAPQRFDVLILDAFSGDAVPVHLLTREAFEIYQRHLKPDGIIAVHISNNYLDLSLVVRSIAGYFGFGCAEVSSLPDPKHGVLAARWMILSRDSKLLAQLTTHPVQVATDTPPQTDMNSVLLPGSKVEPMWTDNHSSLFEVLK